MTDRRDMRTWPVLVGYSYQRRFFPLKLSNPLQKSSSNHSPLLLQRIYSTPLQKTSTNHSPLLFRRPVGLLSHNTESTGPSDHPTVKVSCDMLKLSDTYPLPRHRTQGRLSEPVDGLTALGMAEGRGFQPTLHRLVPANPGREGDTEASTGSQAYGHIASMVHRYMSGPRFPDNYASEAHISSLVDNFRETGTPEESLMPMLRGRLAALARARAFADCHGLVLPKEWTLVQPFSDARQLLDTHEELFFKFSASAPGVTTWLLPAHLLALMFARHNVSPRW